ncbi:MAG TPA: DUF1499 domain-containing protein [Burkholderiaceae bacterium]|jgi:uncharacterized protein (DUF1499 family)|nr:DUF1499 domain-containing protein [Burkholderiaceae bacterium]
MSWWIGAVGLIALVALGVVAYGQAGGLRGHRPADLGLRDGRLKAPSSTRNSVSSQAWMVTGEGAQYARIEPLSFEGSGIDAMVRLKGIVAATPGAHIIEARPDYLSVEFSTRWLRFVDDAEFVILPASQKIDLRSASRLGSEDFGVNRARIEAIRTRFER